MCGGRSGGTAQRSQRRSNSRGRAARVYQRGVSPYFRTERSKFATKVLARPGVKNGTARPARRTISTAPIPEVVRALGRG